VLSVRDIINRVIHKLKYSTRVNLKAEIWRNSLTLDVQIGGLQPRYKLKPAFWCAGTSCEPHSHPDWLQILQLPVSFLPVLQALLSSNDFMPDSKKKSPLVKYRENSLASDGQDDE